MELMRRYLFLQRLKNKTLNSTSAAIDRFSHEPKEPSSIALYPPPQETIPTLIRLNPISSTTMPDTSGVMILRRYLKVRLTTISIGAAAIQEPNISGSPPTNPVAMIGPIKEKLVPWIQSSFAPIGPIRRHCINVDTPEAKRDIDTRKLVFSTSSFSALAMIRGGVMIATKIASRCCKAANRASLNGGRSSTP